MKGFDFFVIYLFDNEDDCDSVCNKIQTYAMMNRSVLHIIGLVTHFHSHFIKCRTSWYEIVPLNQTYWYPELTLYPPQAIEELLCLMRFIRLKVISNICPTWLNVLNISTTYKQISYLGGSLQWWKRIFYFCLSIIFWCPFQVHHNCDGWNKIFFKWKQSTWHI